MGKKLKLNGYWVFAHSVHEEMRCTFEEAIEMADKRWQVKRP